MLCICSRYSSSFSSPCSSGAGMCQRLSAARTSAKSEAGSRREGSGARMDAYFFGQRKAVPTEFAEWLAPDVSAAVSIDMHRGHLDDSSECPCPAPRAREIIEPINAFHRECRRVGVPVIHVKTVLRASGVDDTAGYPSAWPRPLPVPLGPLPHPASPG